MVSIPSCLGHVKLDAAQHCDQTKCSHNGALHRVAHGLIHVHLHQETCVGQVRWCAWCDRCSTPQKLCSGRQQQPRHMRHRQQTGGGWWTHSNRNDMHTTHNPLRTQQIHPQGATPKPCPEPPSALLRSHQRLLSTVPNGHVEWQRVVRCQLPTPGFAATARQPTAGATACRRAWSQWQHGQGLDGARRVWMQWGLRQKSEARRKMRKQGWEKGQSRATGPWVSWLQDQLHEP